MMFNSLMLAGMMILTCCLQVGAQTASTSLPTDKSSVNCKPSTVNTKYNQFFLEAMVQRQKGNHDAAFDLLRHCRDLNPDAPEVHFFLGQYYTALKQPEASMACIKRAAELDPENVTYMETLAQAYINRQDYASAIPVIKGIYERDKGQEEMLEMLFQLYQQVEDYDSAIGVLDQLEQNDGKSERLSMAKSSLYNRIGKSKEAVAEIKALAKQYPNDLNYKAMYGDALLMNDQKDEAVAVYDQVLAEDAENTRVLLSLRNLYEGLEKHEVADSLTRRVLLGSHATTEEKIKLMRQEISASETAGGDSTRVLDLFRQVLALPQPDADMALLCASYMNAKKMPRDSITPVIEKAVAISPDYAPARMQLVAFAWEADDMDRVIALCQEARQYTPDEMLFYYYQGIAYYRRDSLDRALSAFQNGIGVITSESDPAIVSDFYAVMGDILHQRGQAEAAFAAYDSCLVWKADNIGCLNNYAYYLSERGERLSQAEEMSYKTVKAEPKNATYLDTYAWILFMQGRYTEAKVYIDQALQHMDDEQQNAVIIEHAGDIYAQNKDITKALSFWQDAKEKVPDNTLLKRKIKLKKYLKE
jgi:tetratricopeptide (TPR) repeat protein